MYCKLCQFAVNFVNITILRSAFLLLKRKGTGVAVSLQLKEVTSVCESTTFVSKSKDANIVILKCTAVHKWLKKNPVKCTYKYMSHYAIM